MYNQLQVTWIYIKQYATCYKNLAFWGAINEKNAFKMNLFFHSHQYFSIPLSLYKTVTLLIVQRKLFGSLRCKYQDLQAMSATLMHRATCYNTFYSCF